MSRSRCSATCLALVLVLGLSSAGGSWAAGAAPRRATPASAAGTGAADLLLRNGSIYTVSRSRPRAAALAVRDGEIVFVGSDDQAQQFRGPDTRVLDLQGRTAMPGFEDAHMHIIESLHGAWGCLLRRGQPLASYVPVIRACARARAGRPWVLGGGHSIWNVQRYLARGGRPPVALLDDAVPERPAIMMEETSHSVWVNSRALQAAGITAETPDPSGGVILHDPVSGEPNGILVDAAAERVVDLAMAPTPELDALNDEALRVGLRRLNRNGITSLADARVYWKRNQVQTWQRAAANGTLTVRVVLGLWSYPDMDDAEQIHQLASMYRNDPTRRLRVSQIKIYADGEISHTTAATLRPYKRFVRWAGAKGLEYFSRARLTRYITRLERVGFDFHIHAIGDRAVRNALDAIEAARRANGELGARHRLTHLYLVDPADVPRFAALGVIADFQPWGLTPRSLLRWYRPYLGKEPLRKGGLPLRTLYDAGARVVLTSDFDVGPMKPFQIIQAALTRKAESLPDLDAAIRAYTIEAAYLLRQEDRVGTLEPGKRADIIVLDRDPFAVPVEQIGATRVLATFVDGQQVWRSPSF